MHVSEYLLECGLWLFRNLRNLQVAAAAAGVLPAAYLTEEQYLLHDLIACWWLAMKHCSVRTAVPNRYWGGAQFEKMLGHAPRIRFWGGLLLPPSFVLLLPPVAPSGELETSRQPTQPVPYILCCQIAGR